MGTYGEHTTVFESREERERAGRPVDAGWMEQAAREGLPVCHLGGILGFSSLADGVDRMMAGLESDEVTQAMATQGGIVGDAGANRFLERCSLEDQVASASILHGRAAGHEVLAKARSNRQAVSAISTSSSGGSRQRALSIGAKASGSSMGNSTSSALAGTARANIHTLGGPSVPKASPTPPLPRGPPGQPGNGISMGNRRPRGSTGEPKAPAPHPKSSPAPRRSSASVPAPAGGRRLGGARHYDEASVREARLARLDG
jgi:hypothetical protein